MTTETREAWTASHVTAVRQMAERDGTSPEEAFKRVRYMIVNHGCNTFKTNKDLSGLVEQALDVRSHR